MQNSATSPFTITGGLTVNSGGTTLTISAGAANLYIENEPIIGTGNLILANNSATATFVLSSAINNSGAIINSGPSFKATSIGGAIGSNVTGIFENTPEALTLSAVNPFSGPIVVNAGTLSLTGSVGPGSTLTISNAVFNYLPTNTNSSQNLSGLAVGAGVSVINASRPLALGPITRSAGGTLEFNYAVGGQITTTTANTNNILGPWAYISELNGLFYATETAGGIGGYSNYTGPGDSTISTPASILATNGTSNYSLTGTASGNAGPNASIDTLRYTGSGLTLTPNVNGGLSLNGLMNAGTGPLTIGSTGGALKIGTGAAPYANELVVTTGTQALAISSTIAGTGTLTLVSEGPITLSGLVNNTGAIVNSGTGASTTISGAIGTNVASVTENSAQSALVLSGANTYTGPTTVTKGTLIVTGSIASSSAVSLSAGTTLSGSGMVSNITGAGLVAPAVALGGARILTASQVDPSGGLNFDFAFTQPGTPNFSNASASGNDMLHLTGSTPFTFTLTAANTITMNFSGAALAAGQTYLGGFFTDASISNSALSNATFVYTGLNGAVVQYDGLVTVPSANFATGTVTSGEVMEFAVVATPAPEPDCALLLAVGATLLAWRRRRPTA